jgi:tetratricopeptide (TPR) repeat protein
MSPGVDLQAAIGVFLTFLMASSRGGGGGDGGWKKLFGFKKSPGRGSSGQASDTDPEGPGWQRAIRIFVAEGRYRDAAQVLRTKGQHYEAARLLIEGGELLEAGSLLEQTGRYLKAAEVYDQAGDSRRAAENYRRFLQERWGGLAGTRSPADHAEFVHYCRQAGRAFERAGLLEQAAEMMERGEHWEEAGALCVKLTRYVKAADLFQRADLTDRAADAYARAGDRMRAAQMRGEHLYKNDRKNEAAVQFLLGGDALRAAEVYQEADNYLDAARCYEHAGAHRQAGDAYRACGQLARAAEMFGRSHDYELAGTLYEEAGDLAHAGEMYAEAGLHYRAGVAEKKAGLQEQAVIHLQQVKPGAPEFKAAALELAQHFLDRGLAGVALEKLRKVLSGLPFTAENLDLFFAMAEAQEQAGNYSAAKVILQKIVAEHYGYRDAVARLEKVERLAESAQKRADVGPAVFRSELGEAERYEFLEKLGSGGMGVVYKAYDRLLRRVVAYKMLMEQFMEIEEIRERFLREAQSAAGLNHPNIVTIYDTGEDRGRFFISMEFVEGTTYYKLLDGEGRLSVPETLHFMLGVLRALAHAATRGVVHRDIKPGNVMLTRDKVVKITDFGLAKVLRQGRNEGSQKASGTPLYMSPEQILGKPFDFRTDLYAFGGTAYHLLAGEPPFVEGEILYHHVHSEPRPLSELREEVPRSLEAVIMRCLQKDPDRRFQSAEEVLAVLRPIEG